MVRWIFLDVGNILLDEDPLTFHNFRRHVEAVRQVRPDLTFNDLLAEREAAALRGSRWPVHEVASRYLDEVTLSNVWDDVAAEVRDRFVDLAPPVSGAEDCLNRLAAHFPLGVIANQGVECRARLASLGWLDRFGALRLPRNAVTLNPT